MTWWLGSERRWVRLRAEPDILRRIRTGGAQVARGRRMARILAIGRRRTAANCSAGGGLGSVNIPPYSPRSDEREPIWLLVGERGCFGHQQAPGSCLSGSVRTDPQATGGEPLQSHTPGGPLHDKTEESVFRDVGECLEIPDDGPLVREHGDAFTNRHMAHDIRDSDDGWTSAESANVQITHRRRPLRRQFVAAALSPARNGGQCPDVVPRGTIRAMNDGVGTDEFGPAASRPVFLICCPRRGGKPGETGLRGKRRMRA